LFSVAAALAGCQENPVTGKKQLVLISQEQEIEQGNQIYPVATQLSHGETPHRETQSFVETVGGGLARSSERPDLPWQFNVVDHNDPNAYSLPGGKVSFTRGLFSRLSSEDQVAAVLGHEIGHVAARHAVSAASRQALIGLVISVSGSVLQGRRNQGPGAILMAERAGAALLLTKYSRDQERQADELGMKYMAKAGYNPKAFVEVMQILERAQEREPSRLEALLASHPLTTERIATAEQRLASGFVEEQKRDMRAADFDRAAAPIRAEMPAFVLADEARKLVEKQETAAAVQRLEHAVAMVPESPILNALWSDSLYDLGQYARSEQISARAPNLYYGRLVNGAANWRLKNDREALASLELAEKLVPGTVLVAYFRGRVEEDLGDRDAAAADYVKVAKATQGQGPYGQYALTRLQEWGYVQSGSTTSVSPR
jgi:predicted Zn-dependent protease